MPLLNLFKKVDERAPKQDFAHKKDIRNFLVKAVGVLTQVDYGRNKFVSPEYNLEEIRELTRREKEILFCISKGKTNHEISTDLCITEHTVKKHISNIFEKLNLRDRTHAALYVHERGII